MTDPLDRILNALDVLHSEKLDPVLLDAWQDARSALHEVREHRAALVTVARRARDFVEIMYERALDTGDEDMLTLLAGPGSAGGTRRAGSRARDLA